MSTKIVPTVTTSLLVQSWWQRGNGDSGNVKNSQNSQKTVKTAKITIGVPIVTCLPRLYQQYTNSAPIVKNSQKTVKTANMTINVPIVTGLPRLYQQLTSTVPVVKHSQKTVKTAKMTVGVTNRHMSTQSPPNTQSPLGPTRAID